MNKQLLQVLADSEQPISTNPVEPVKSWLTSAGTWFTEFGWLLAALCVVIVAIMFMLPGRESMSNGKKAAISILIGCAVLSCGPGIISALRAF